MPKIIAADELDQHIGSYLVFYHEDQIVGRIDKVDKSKNEVEFTRVGGDDDGKRYRGRYDFNAVDLKVYDEDEAIIACLE